MTGLALFDLVDFAPEPPSWAVECFYCRPDDTGCYDERRHLDSHLPLTCMVCGGTSPNRLLFENSHIVSLGSSWSHDALLCTSLSLRLNHLAYDIQNRETPDVCDLSAIDLGWRIAPDGTAIRPEGWPCGDAATVCRAIAVESCALGGTVHRLAACGHCERCGRPLLSITDDLAHHCLGHEGTNA